jgi:RNA polymerase sigma-70 factor (ECF subfamily)
MSHPQPDLMSLVYDELRAIARRCMAGERRDHTLQPTALVHEAWGRLAGRIGAVDVVHFKALVATTMRRVLVDHARRKRGPVHGGDVPHVSLTAIGDLGDDQPTGIDVLALDEALERLASVHAEPARVVELRFFAGLTHPEIATALATSLSTVEDRWRFARAWLRRALDAPSPPPAP